VKATIEGAPSFAHIHVELDPGEKITAESDAMASMDADLENEAMMAWVAETGRDARFVMSLCDGAFVLAAAGLLDGRAVTTFPGEQDRFAATFPDLDLRRGISFVHDGRLLTSQGGAKSYDVAMYLVDHLYGEDVARGVGRGLIIDWPPAAEEMPAIVIAPPTSPRA